MQGVFAVTHPAALEDKTVVLVDDVITTGATLEAMGAELMQVPGLQLQLLCFAFTQKY
jgi:predicted amidophosphoribosyltransferase